MWVWAVAPGVHKVFQKTNEYRVVFAFTNLTDLNTKLADEGCSNSQVDRMVIVSHGDDGGVLMFDPPLRANASAVQNDLIRLRSFLKPDAMIICIGCISGVGGAGDTLYKSISSIVAGCTFVSYTLQNTVYDWTTGGWSVSKVGGSQAVTRNDEWSEAAKWAKNGAITRPALNEVLTFQSKDPSHRLVCGSEHCSGHGKGGDFCDPYRRILWPAWVDRPAESQKKQPAPVPQPHRPHNR